MVSFSILGPFGPRRTTATPRAGKASPAHALRLCHVEPRYVCGVLLTPPPTSHRRADGVRGVSTARRAGVHAEAMNGTEFADVMRRRGRVVSVEDELPLTAPGNLVISWRPAPKQKKRAALATMGLRLRFYAPSLLRIATASVLPLVRRLPVKTQADVSALWSGCRGCSARTGLALQKWRGSGRRKQVAPCA